MEKDSFDQRDMTILVVDDEPRIRDYVRMNLELERYRVIEASNGREAMDQLREHLPDLVVLDVMMPEMDGFETLRHIREVSTVPVIILTVRQTEQDKIHGLDLGADDYIAKTASPRELHSRIRALLRRAYMADAKLDRANCRAVRFGNQTTQVMVTQFERARLWNASLRGAALTKAMLVGVDFQGADLTGASLQDTDCRDANFTGARLGRTNLEQAILIGVRGLSLPA